MGSSETQLRESAQRCCYRATLLATPLIPASMCRGIPQGGGGVHPVESVVQDLVIHFLPVNPAGHKNAMKTTLSENIAKQKKRSGENPAGETKLGNTQRGKTYLGNPTCER